MAEKQHKQLPRLKPGEYVKGDLIVSPRLAAQEMGFVLHGVCEETSVETGQTIQNYRSAAILNLPFLESPGGDCPLILHAVGVRSYIARTPTRTPTQSRKGSPCLRSKGCRIRDRFLCKKARSRTDQVGCSMLGVPAFALISLACGTGQPACCKSFLYY